MFTYSPEGAVATISVLDRRGRRVAAEVMVVTPAVSQLIREGKAGRVWDAIAGNVGTLLSLRDGISKHYEAAK